MKNILVLVMVFCSLPVNAGWFDSKEVEAVKGAQLNACPRVTLVQMVDSFIASPSWSSFKAEGRSFVNIEGRVEFNNKPVNALIQFKIFNDDSLDINAFELNEIAQNRLMMMGLIDKMCESAITANSTSDDTRIEHSGKVSAQVLTMELHGEEALKITTNKGDFIMNSFAMSDDEFKLLDTALMNKTALCFEGEDHSFKERVSAKCF